MGGASRTAYPYASQTTTRNLEQRARATACRLDQAARVRSTPITLTNDNAEAAMIRNDRVPQGPTYDRIAAANPQVVRARFRFSRFGLRRRRARVSRRLGRLRQQGRALPPRSVSPPTSGS
jgi:hypothetical protein